MLKPIKLVRYSDLGKPMTNKWVGGFLRNRLRLTTMKTGGVYVLSRTELTKVEALAHRYGLTSNETNLT